MLVQSFLHRAVSTNDVTPQPPSTRARSESLDARYERRHMQRDEAAKRDAVQFISPVGLVGVGRRTGRGGGGGPGAGGSNLTYNSDTEGNMAVDGVTTESGGSSLSAVLVGRKRRRVVVESDSDGEEVNAEEATERRRPVVVIGRLGGGGKQGWVT